MWRVIVGVAVIGGILCVGTSQATPVAANGQPVHIVLTYLPDVSNWGPKEAVGVAEVTLAEGEVTLGATGLPRLAGESYVVWLMATQGSAVQRVGNFNADEHGNARFNKTLPQELPKNVYDLVLVSVEPADQSPSAPGPKHSIAGRFPRTLPEGQLPGELPNTGDVGATASSFPMSATGQAIGLMLMAIVLGLTWWWRRRPQKEVRR